MNLITLQKEYTMLLKDTITEFLSPNFIYLPISNIVKLEIDPKDTILKGQKIYDLMYSPVSGKIAGIKEFYDINNKKQKYLVIANDFKEKKIKNKVKKITDISKNELLEIIKHYDLNIYNKINNESNKMIINAFEEQLYVGNKMYICKYFNKEILNVLDLISQILEIKDIQINFKDTDSSSISNINNVIGMYPNINIKYLPDKFLISNKKILIEYLNIKENFIYLDIEDLYKLYQYFERKKVKEEMIVTITGDAINNPQVINCKIGSSLKDIMDELIELNTDDYKILINNLLGNLLISNNEFILTEDINSIFIMKNKEIKEIECIRCGKCNDVCPVKINVFNLVNNKKCDKSDCINCGLCTYICPSYININKHLGGEHHE